MTAAMILRVMNGISAGYLGHIVPSVGVLACSWSWGGPIIDGSYSDACILEYQNSTISAVIILSEYDCESILSILSGRY